MSNEFEKGVRDLLKGEVERIRASLRESFELPQADDAALLQRCHALCEEVARAFSLMTSLSGYQKSSLSTAIRNYESRLEDLKYRAEQFDTIKDIVMEDHMCSDYSDY